MWRPMFVGERSRSVARAGIMPTYPKSSDTVAEGDTANTPQTSGLRKFGRSPIVFGYGNNQYANHGRPRWRIGKRPAHATAKMVMASAKLLIDLRPVWRKSSRTGEMSGP